MCDSGRFGQLRGTVGNFALQPSQTNVIPFEAVLTVDLRNPDDAHMTAAEKHLAEFVDELAQRHGVTVSWERMAKTAVIPFHDSIQDVIADSAERLAVPYIRTMSGAGHDAQEIAATCPTAMIFVAGEDGGISHAPREYSRPEACGNAIDVLANAVLTLAGVLE
jgi:N-carbamoyl-L-amino-acid hydrolase